MPVWLSATPDLSFTSVPFQATGSHGGLRATQELSALVRPDERFAPGLRVTAVLTDGVEQVTLFQGYLDAAERQLDPGQDYTQLTARGPLGRLIGETAYRPVALLDLPGRGAWWSGFYDAASGTAVNALAAADGDWTPEVLAGTYRLSAPGGGEAFIPQAYPGMVGAFYLAFTAAEDLYLAVGNTDETDKAGLSVGEAWYAGLRNGQLVIGQERRGAWTGRIAIAATGYTAGTAAGLWLFVSPGRLEVVLAPTRDCAESDWIRLGYNLVGEDWPAAWAATVVGERALLGDGTYAAKPVYLYEVLGCTADIPWNVGEAVQRVAERAGASLVNASTTYTPDDEDPYPANVKIYVSLVNCLIPSLTDGDDLYLKARLDATGHQPNGTHLVFHSGYVSIDGLDQPYPDGWTGLTNLRVVWYDDLLALYQADRLLLCCHLHPRYASGYLWASVSFTLIDLYMPAEAAAWDYNQPADSILGRLLERRRAYLVEHADGTLGLSASPEGDEAIGPSNPFLGHQSYERDGAVYGEFQGREARGVAGLLGVIGMQDTVYVLDPEAPAYGLSSLTNDNPWALSVEDALREATLTIYDNRRARRSCDVSYLLDPALEITDIFTLADGSQWLAAAYTWSFTMEERAKIEGRLQGIARVSPPAAGIWGTTIWSEGTWR